MWRVTALCVWLWLRLASADKPAHCSLGDILGEWELFLDADGSPPLCGWRVPDEGPRTVAGSGGTSVRVALRFDAARDAFWVAQGARVVGTWTPVYDFGVFIALDHWDRPGVGAPQGRLELLAYWSFEVEEGVAYSQCGRTLSGWGVGGASPAKHFNRSYGGKEEGRFCWWARKPRDWSARYNRVPLSRGSFLSDSLSLAQYASQGFKPWSPPVKRRRRSRHEESLSELSQSYLEEDELPASFSWAEAADARARAGAAGLVPPAPDQSACGACYAFATADMLTSRFLIARARARTGIGLEAPPSESIGHRPPPTGPAPRLSTFQLTHCSVLSQGCHGGFNFTAEHFIKQYGLVTEECEQSVREILQDMNVSDIDDKVCMVLGGDIEWDPKAIKQNARGRLRHRPPQALLQDAGVRPPEIEVAAETPLSILHRAPGCGFSVGTKRWGYVGDRGYGKMTPEEIKDEIWHNGPVAVAVAPPKGFQSPPRRLYSLDDPVGRSLFAKRRRGTKRDHEGKAKLLQGPYVPITETYQDRISWEKADHAMLLVGWGRVDGLPVWRLRNSWGSKWGAQGFVEVPYGSNYMGLEFSATYADADVRPLIALDK